VENFKLLANTRLDFKLCQTSRLDFTPSGKHQRSDAPTSPRDLYEKRGAKFLFSQKKDMTALAILSEKGHDCSNPASYDYFVIGAKGYLGSQCVKVLLYQGFKVFESNERLEKIDKIRDEIIRSSAKFVVCAAGISGKPTVEWCEMNEEETKMTNYTHVLTLFNLTKTLDVHCIYFGSGLIYTNNKTEYTEEDVPTLTNRVYCKWRCELEKMIPLFENVLYLRIFFPVTLDGHPKCFMTKMLGRTSSVHDVTVSITVVPDLFQTLSTLARKKKTGIYNFVNRGGITLPRLLDLYSAMKEPTPYNVSCMLKGYTLSTEKLEKEVTIMSTEDALVHFLSRQSSS